MRVRILGPLEVGDVAASSGPPKQRTVLGLLVARANRAVPVGDLVDEVWEQRPPRSAVANIRSYVAGLRRAFGPAGAHALDRTAAGYVLRTDPAPYDLGCFRRHVAAARAARSRADPGTAVREFGRAAGLWRGAVLADVPAGPVLAGWAVAVEEERVLATEEWAEALLAAGAYGEAAGRARQLLAAHPLRERPYAILARALYRAGDVASALDTVDAARRTLAEHLGVDVSDELAQLRQSVLARDVVVSPGSPGSGPAGPVVLPRQLPTAVRGFAGRAAELNRLRLLVPGRQGPGRGTTVVTVTGEAGVGKTALVLQLAHEVAPRFPDGQLYAGLRGRDGHGRPVAQVLAAFLDALGVPAGLVPADEQDRAALYRSVVAGRRMLLVLDDAATAGQVRPLLPGSARCATLVTGRTALHELIAEPGAYPFPLGVLPPREAHAVLAARLGPDRVAAEPEAVRRIVSGCAGRPRALADLAAVAATDTSGSLSGLVEGAGFGP